MKAAQLRDLTPEELNEKFRHFKEELFNLRFQLATGQLDNTARIQKVKTNIAQVLTFLRQREIEAVGKDTPEAVEAKPGKIVLRRKGYRRDKARAEARRSAAIERARKARDAEAAEALRTAREEMAAMQNASADELISGASVTAPVTAVVEEAPAASAGVAPEAAPAAKAEPAAEAAPETTATEAVAADDAPDATPATEAANAAGDDETKE